MTSTVGIADRLGIDVGLVVQEVGFGEDCDEQVRTEVQERIGSELLDEDVDDVVDMVLLWWRSDDGDLADALVDAVTPLAEDGVIWVLTPKSGRDGYVEPSEIAEAVATAGLSRASAVGVGESWSGVRVVSPQNAKRTR
ncbi:DUF3052 domain-containing protein [Streptomyces racemochromogenes]|uniref:DUF3052 domain-containing protein n=1 Tax=Streptomyces racemochromogenes TaxID=67353 RepID=A0ABW7P7Q4_9ACTN